MSHSQFFLDCYFASLISSYLRTRGVFYIFFQFAATYFICAMYTNCKILIFLLACFSVLLFQFSLFLSLLSEFPYHVSSLGILFKTYSLARIPLPVSSSASHIFVSFFFSFRCPLLPIYVFRWRIFLAVFSFALGSAPWRHLIDVTQHQSPAFAFPALPVCYQFLLLPI